MSKHVLRKHLRGFTSVSNTIIAALKKDLEVLGFYTYLLSLPNDWEFYKSSLCKDCSIGIKKLEKLLKRLCALGVVQIRRNRDAQGRFAHFDVDIYDTELTNQQINESNSVQKLHENDAVHPPVHFGHVDRTDGRLGAPIKETLTKETKKQQKQKLYRASDDAPPIESYPQADLTPQSIPPTPPKESLFDSFWRSYPVRKNRKRAEEIWKRKKLDAIADKIISHVTKASLSDSQWLDGFAPHPATYLRNERWNDEITQQTQKRPNNGQRKETSAERYRRIADEVHADLRANNHGRDEARHEKDITPGFKGISLLN